MFGNCLDLEWTVSVQTDLAGSSSLPFGTAGQLGGQLLECFVVHNRKQAVEHTSNLRSS